MITKINRRLGRVRFRDLELLLALADTGSLRQAATVLGVSQPALSKSLREVEDAFGVPLYIRSRNRLLPTQAGRGLVADAEMLLNELAHARSSAQSSVVAPVRLGVVTFLALTFLPRLLLTLPHTNVVISEKPTPELIEELEHGRLDAILAPYPYKGELNEAISHQVIFQEPLVIVAGRSLTVRASWAALAKAPWIMPPSHFLVRRSVEARILTSGHVPPSPVVESFSVTTNLQLAMHGHGVAALPECVMLEAEAAGRIRRIPVKPAAELPPVCLVCRRGAAEHRRTQVIREAVQLAMRVEKQDRNKRGRSR